MSGKEMCANCRHATRDYAEYFGGLKCWFVDGCKLDKEPEYNEEEEAWECDGVRYPTIAEQLHEDER